MSNNLTTLALAENTILGGLLNRESAKQIKLELSITDVLKITSILIFNPIHQPEILYLAFVVTSGECIRLSYKITEILHVTHKFVLCESSHF